MAKSSPTTTASLGPWVSAKRPANTREMTEAANWLPVMRPTTKVLSPRPWCTCSGRTGSAIPMTRNAIRTTVMTGSNDAMGPAELALPMMGEERLGGSFLVDVCFMHPIYASAAHDIRGRTTHELISITYEWRSRRRRMVGSALSKRARRVRGR